MSLASKGVKPCVKRGQTGRCGAIEEHTDLRYLLEDIRTRRIATRAVGPPLSALLPALGDQCDVRIEAEIASVPPADVADVADDIRMITREAIANAVDGMAVWPDARSGVTATPGCTGDLESHCSPGNASALLT